LHLHPHLPARLLCRCPCASLAILSGPRAWAPLSLAFGSPRALWGHGGRKVVNFFCVFSRKDTCRWKGERGKRQCCMAGVTGGLTPYTRCVARARVLARQTADDGGVFRLLCRSSLRASCAGCPQACTRVPCSMVTAASPWIQPTSRPRCSTACGRRTARWTTPASRHTKAPCSEHRTYAGNALWLVALSCERISRGSATRNRGRACAQHAASGSCFFTEGGIQSE